MFKTLEHLLIRTYWVKQDKFNDLLDCCAKEREGMMNPTPARQLEIAKECGFTRITRYPEQLQAYTSRVANQGTLHKESSVARIPLYAGKQP